MVNLDVCFSFSTKKSWLAGKMWRQFQREIYQESSILLLQDFRWKPRIAAYHRPTKVHIVKATVFPEFIYRCESWTIKKAEHWRTDAFKLWCWRRLLRVPWTARKSNSNTHWKDWGCSWSSNTLDTICEEPTHWKRSRCWERLKAKGEGDDRGWDGWMISLTQ